MKLKQALLKEDGPVTVNDDLKKKIYTHLIAVQKLTSHMDTELKVELAKKLNAVTGVLGISSKLVSGH